jgi:hypothetical protein
MDISIVLLSSGGTRWRSWLRHCATAGRSPIRVPDEVEFFNLPNISSRTMALGSNQPLTEMSTLNLPGGKKRPADNLAAIYGPNI